MGRPKKHIEPRLSAIELPKIVDFPEPVALKTEKGTRNQIRHDEGTYVWGIDDALPLRILQAVDASPTASACAAMVQNFTAGAGFSDKGLMSMPIDKYGTTLWDFHCQLAQYLSLLDGFTVNFKLDPSFTITNAYGIPFETGRMVAPHEQSTRVDCIKTNPYFGTTEYRNEFTQKYPVWDGNKSNLAAQIKEYGEMDFPGQMYWYGVKRPLYKHYPVPHYWSGADAIYSDAKIMEYGKKTLQNGFLQSTLITMIGDPDKPSTKNMRTETGTDGTKRQRSDKTVGQQFDEYMRASFSGTSKAGTAMVIWALNKDTSPTIQAFPSNINFELVNGTDVQNMRKITIAFQVPAILVNLPQQENSLGSDGNSLEKSIELMQARTLAKRKTLEQFYNNVLLPNFQTKTTAKVEITNYRPVDKNIEVPDYIWQALSQESKTEFIKKYYPDIPVVTQAPAPIVPGQQATVTSPEQEAIDSILRGLSRSELAKFYGYVNDYKKGRATLEQTKVFLKAYKLNDDQIMLFLNEV